MPVQFLSQTIIFVPSIGGALGYGGLSRLDVDPGMAAVVQFASTLTWLVATYLVYTAQRWSHPRAVAALPFYWLAHWIAA
ncbi:hypothetical protein F0Q45_03970 [Mycobacterium simiae]|uniref:Uncharacterized protein n=1 Tax=Mycobacterium simiae TaxID=1784 RepID=A0A5B1BU51_MYCSI|nr:hypothetical protein [Mycobacterium simiae]KAA1251502.1 hypothetical protein F0Q45_03970 [Mycobacterium simiae]